MKLKTRSNINVHPIGVGTWNIGSIRTDEGKVEALYGNEGKEIKAIQHSISQGQNHIDTTELYGVGHTEEVVGQAISSFKRDDLYLAAKLWKTHVAKDAVRPAVEKMLKRLQTDYIDILYIHAPWDDAPWVAALTQIDALIEEGVVRNLGVSNFKISHLKKAMRIAQNRIFANQLHFNPMYKQDATKTVRSFCKENDIDVVAYRPIERQAVNSNPAIQKVAQKHKATCAQISLAWLRQLGVYSIPKAISHAHINENLRSLDITLSDKEMRDLER